MISFYIPIFHFAYWKFCARAFGVRHILLHIFYLGPELEPGNFWNLNSPTREISIYCLKSNWCFLHFTKSASYISYFLKLQGEALEGMQKWRILYYFLRETIGKKLSQSDTYLWYVFLFNITWFYSRDHDTSSLSFHAISNYEVHF